jgi:hypothetical protein
MMSNSTASFGFHEASIVEISQENGTIRLLLEGVHINDTEVTTVRLSFVNVQTISREDSSVSDIKMEAIDGEILTLKLTDHSAELIVLWTDFQERKENTVYYRIECDHVVVVRT